MVAYPLIVSTCCRDTAFLNNEIEDMDFPLRDTLIGGCRYASMKEVKSEL
jgi:hypothetical protein